MLYPIQILKKAIDVHISEIGKLNLIEPGMTCDLLFASEEIKERKNYIQQLQNAVKLLSKKINEGT